MLLWRVDLGGASGKGVELAQLRTFCHLEVTSQNWMGLSAEGFPSQTMQQGVVPRGLDPD